MKNLAYKVLFTEGQTVEGVAQSLFIKDSIGVLTLHGGAAPLISLLKNGTLDVRGEDGKTVSYPYREGLLRLNQTSCTVTILY